MKNCNTIWSVILQTQIISMNMCTEPVVLNVPQLNISNLKHENTMFVLYDNLSNKILKERFTNLTTIVTDQLPSGIYFYEIWNSKERIAAGKLIKKSTVNTM